MQLRHPHPKDADASAEPPTPVTLNPNQMRQGSCAHNEHTPTEQTHAEAEAHSRVEDGGDALHRRHGDTHRGAPLSPSRPPALPQDALPARRRWPS